MLNFGVVLKIFYLLAFGIVCFTLGWLAKSKKDKKILESMKGHASFFPEIGSDSHSQAEQEFMGAVSRYVSEHISDSELTSDMIAQAMKTPRKRLSEKVRASTGMSVHEYVRTSRLKKAAELLAEHKYRINEVAYLVGFSTPSYFTKQFEEHFGMKPSEFIKST